MLNYLKKFAMDIFPSVAATIIGAYIVNHYIVARPDAPATAAVSAVADPKSTAAKPTDVSNVPEAGVKARGMSERTLMERSASEKATVTEKPAEKSADLKPSVDSPAETASIPTDQRRHQAAPKAIAKLTPAATTPAAPAETPVSVAPDEGRDANDLARAAIERLRKEPAQRPQEASRPTDVARVPVPEAPHVVMAPSLKPLPPPIMVSNPANETADQPAQQRPPYAAAAQDPNRPTPPADIPVAPRPPLDLRAEATMPAAKEDHTSVTDDVLSSMKSVFHAVLPK